MPHPSTPLSRPLPPEAFDAEHAEARQQQYLLQHETKMLLEARTFHEAIAIRELLRGNLWERLQKHHGRCSTRNGHFFSAADSELEEVFQSAREKWDREENVEAA